MATSKFWRRTAKRFRRLQAVPPQPGEVQRASHNGLCAWWRPGGWDDGKPYHFFDDGDDIEANSNIERLFKIVAESAGVELGHPGSGEAAVFAWLDHLRRAGIYVASSTEGSWIIHRVCDASAEYCLKCETDVRTGVKASERALDESAVSPSLAASKISLSLARDNINSVSSANTEEPTVAVFVEAAKVDNKQAVAERAARRQAVVMPILAKKHWRRGRLATKAGVAKNSVYGYLDGTIIQISDENRTAIAEALGIERDQLPE